MKPVCISCANRRADMRSIVATAERAVFDFGHAPDKYLARIKQIKANIAGHVNCPEKTQ